MALGDVIYRAAALWTRLAGNTTSTRKFLSQTGTGAVSAAPAWNQVTDADLSTSNITTNNVTTAKHGFAPILPNDASKYLDGTGAYTVPPGTGTGTVSTTGSPASGNLAKFSGTASITNADLTGDVTTSGGVATTLANSGVSAATYGSATAIPVVTFNAKGQATSATTATATALVASVSYFPTNTSVSTSSTTPADIDTTNLKITFTAPSTGHVLVSLSAMGLLSAGTTGYGWCLHDGSAVVTATRVQVLGNISTPIRPVYRVIITGLTPGNSYTYTWQHYITATAATGDARYGGAGTATDRGPAVMEVWSAP